MLHVVHGAVVALGVAIVGYLLLPRSRQSQRRIKDLRSAADRGTLTELARQRAAVQLDLVSPGPAVPSCLYVAAGASVLAAIVHAAVGPEHFHEAIRFGVFFLLLGTAQLAFAPMVVRRPTVALLATAVALNALTVLLWSLTRTVGLPLGLAEVEGVGLLDLLATTAELILIASCLVALRTVARRPVAGQVGWQQRAGVLAGPGAATGNRPLTPVQERAEA